MARRKRDLVSWDTLVLAKNESNQTTENSPTRGDSVSSSAIPVPTADPEGQSAEATPSLDTEAALAAKHDPTIIDPQLQKALQYLKDQTGGRSAQPGRA